jgi:trimeric autotransporter adhesin
MTSYTITQIPAPRTPLIDETTGLLSREWFRWFNNVNSIVGSGLGVIAVINGGTGQSTYTNGQLLIGNSTGNTLSKNTLTPGAGIGVTNGPGLISIANTGVLSNLAGAGVSVSSATGNVTVANTGVLSIIAGTGISVSSATGNVTIANTAVGVTSFSAGTTGLTPNSPTTGAVVLAGTLAVANGGTGATTDSVARTNLGLGGGLSVTITTAQLTALGTQGSMTFVNGILTAQTQAT